MKGLRILLLRASRLVRRAPVRSLTTGLLVMAAVLVGSLALSESRGHYEANSSVESQLGKADVRYNLFGNGFFPPAPPGGIPPTPDLGGDGPVDGARPIAEQVATVIDALPKGADVAVLESFGNARVGAVAWSDPLTVYQGPWGDPLLDGVVDLADGRLPGPGEVVVPPSLAVSEGLDIGDRLVLLEPAAVLDVVGIGSAGAWPQLLVAADEFVASEAPAQGTAATLAGASVLATLPPGQDAPEVQVGSTPGDVTVAFPFDRGSFIGPPPTGTSTGIVALALAFVGLSAGAAFAIGAARRRRALGLLAVNGATQGQLRLAAGAEAVVVSVPAVLVGAVAATLLPTVWVQVRLPGWDRIWQMALPLRWVGLLAVAAVAAAVLGTIVFSGSVTGAAVPALLDARGVGRRSAPARPRRGVWAVVLTVVAISLVLLPIPALLLAGRSGALVWGLLVALGVWGAGALAVVAVARWALGRHAVGRLVGRDLVRRPSGAGAAVMVIAIWSFAAVVWTLTSGTGGDDRPGEFERSSPSAEPTPQPEEMIGTITIQPPARTAVVQRSSTAPENPGELQNDLRDRLAALGLVTQPATVGVFAGPCEVCPEGYRPTVMMLDSVSGLGLPRLTETALLAGSVVTALDLEGIDGSTVGGQQVTVAPLPLNANAAMLNEFAPEGAALEDPVEVLVGSTTELSDTAAADVTAELADAGVLVSSDDQRVQPITTAEAYGLGLAEPTDRDALWWATSVLLLALVTMAATAAHRREHGEVAHVLWLLGAGPGAGRRLAALTAGTIAAVGVLIGSSAAATVVAATWLRRTDLDIADVVEPRRVLMALAVIVVVPAAAATLGRLLPPPRSVRSDVGPA